jgi:hypothetical protein
MRNDAPDATEAAAERSVLGRKDEESKLLLQLFPFSDSYDIFTRIYVSIASQDEEYVRGRVYKQEASDNEGLIIIFVFVVVLHFIFLCFKKGRVLFVCSGSEALIIKRVGRQSGSNLMLQRKTRNTLVAIFR